MIVRASPSRSRGLLLEVSVQIDPEAEEAVSELLERIFNRYPSIYRDLEKRTTKVFAFIDAFTRDQRRTLKDGLELIAEAGVRIGRGELRVRRVARENWAESWKKHFKPLEISPRLLVLPSWSKRKPKRGQAIVILDPGLSFGTGHHPTTAFCLEQIALLRDVREKQSMLDMGCGSGILSIAAAKLGFSPVTAFDFDPDCVRIAKENAALNRVQIRVSQQDLRELRLRSQQQFNVVCANLIYDLLIQERERILARLSWNGTFVLAGILKEQFPKVQRAYEAAGLKVIASRVTREWRSGAFRFRD